MMIKRNQIAATIGLVLILAAVVPLSADDFRFTGFVDHYIGIEPTEGSENLRTRIFMEPWFSGSVGDSGIKWTLSAKTWVQPVGEPEAISPADILDEAWLFMPIGPFDLSLGQKLTGYGFADVFGPLNVVHGGNSTLLSLDDAYDSSLPVPMIQLQFYPSFESSIDLVYVPLTRPDCEQINPVYLSSTQDTIVWNTDSYILDNPHSIFINYQYYGEKADFQLFYGWYTDQAPDFIVETIDSAVPSEITTVYNKAQTFGAAYSIRLGNGTFSQDAAFKWTTDFAGTDIGARNSELTLNTQWLVNLPGDILSQYSLVYSYFFNHGNHATGSDPEAAAYIAEAVQDFHTQPLQHIAFIVAHFEQSFLREKMKAQLNVAYFFSPEMYFAPRLSYAMTDNWTLETGADINLGDPSDAALRRNPNNDNVYLRLAFRY
ncbi:MAG: hypothetical protein RBT68_11275 [Spirochaetia bacterium]|jgi:hypothetical protein|nr:hypothetical protein [Spirochaetia bacterium]